jgi:hypothetical protein
MRVSSHRIPMSQHFRYKSHPTTAVVQFSGYNALLRHINSSGPLLQLAAQQPRRQQLLPEGRQKCPPNWTQQLQEHQHRRDGKVLHESIEIRPANRSPQRGTPLVNPLPPNIFVNLFQNLDYGQAVDKRDQREFPFCCNLL